MSEELRAGLYAFDLVQRRAKRPAGAPDKSLARDVTKVGVVGAGLMASQLALLFVRRLEVPVVLTDIDQERVDKGVGYVHGEVDKLLGKGRINQDKANRLKALVTGSTGKEAFADADFVIEAVFEEMKVKQQVFAEVEAVVSPECVLATNTSSLSVTEMAAGLEHPERVVGFHFFNPVAVLPLLEIARAEQDRRRVGGDGVRRRQGAEEVLRAGRGPAGVRRQPAAHPLPRRGHQGGRRGHAVRGGRQGARAARPADDAVRAAAAGRPRGRAARRRDDARGVPGPLLRVGEPRPAGGGRQDRRLHLGEPAARWSTPRWPSCSRPGDAPSSEDEVRRRALDALAEEIRLMLDEGVVEDVRDIDLAMLLGAGWPFHLGGVTPYLDREGVSERVTGHAVPAARGGQPPARLSRASACRSRDRRGRATTWSPSGYAAEIAGELTHKPLDRGLLDAVAELAGGGPVADVGCGPGHVAAYLAGRGARTVGLDLSPGMCAVATGRGRAGCRRGHDRAAACEQAPWRGWCACTPSSTSTRRRGPSRTGSSPGCSRTAGGR